MSDEVTWTSMLQRRSEDAVEAPLVSGSVWLETLAARVAARVRAERRPLLEVGLLGPRRSGALAAFGEVASEGTSAEATVAVGPRARYEGLRVVGGRLVLDAPLAPRESRANRWLFEARGLGAYRGALLVFSEPSADRWHEGDVGVVRAVAPVRREGRALASVEFESPVRESSEVRMPAAVARLASVDETNRAGVDLFGTPFAASASVTLDALYPGIARGSVVVVDVAPRGALDERRLYVSRVTDLEVRHGDLSTPPRTILALEVDLGDERPDAESFRVHFDLVPAGRLADLPKSTVDVADLRAGLAVVGPVDPPEGRTTVEQVFLLEDADGKGARVRGRLVFDVAARSARFTLLDDAAAVAVATFKAPLSLYDGLVTLTEGETVEREVLGSGDGRRARQSFELARKPLTHLPAPLATDPPLSTLRTFVDGIAWEERETFYGAGPNERVFVVEHAADGTATVPRSQPSTRARGQHRLRACTQGSERDQSDKLGGRLESHRQRCMAGARYVSRRRDVLENEGPLATAVAWVEVMTWRSTVRGRSRFDAGIVWLLSVESTATILHPQSTTVSACWAAMSLAYFKSFERRSGSQREWRQRSNLAQLSASSNRVSATLATQPAPRPARGGAVNDLSVGHSRKSQSNLRAGVLAPVFGRSIRSLAAALDPQRRIRLVHRCPAHTRKLTKARAHLTAGFAGVCAKRVRTSPDASVLDAGATLLTADVDARRRRANAHCATVHGRTGLTHRVDARSESAGVATAPAVSGVRGGVATASVVATAGVDGRITVDGGVDPAGSAHPRQAFVGWGRASRAEVAEATACARRAFAVVVAARTRHRQCCERDVEDQMKKFRDYVSVTMRHASNPRGASSHTAGTSANAQTWRWPNYG